MKLGPVLLDYVSQSNNEIPYIPETTYIPHHDLGTYSMSTYINLHVGNRAKI